MATISIYLSSCTQKDKYENVTPTIKFKFSKNDTLLFKSESKTDSFIINSCGCSYETIDKTAHFEECAIYYKRINSSILDDSIFHTYQVQYGNDGAGIIWRNIYSSPEIASYTKVDTIIKIGTKSIFNVIILKAKIGLKYWPNDIVSVYYSNGYGIIQYERFNGLIYKLDSNCINKYLND